jgi:hypothetical protein
VGRFSLFSRDEELEDCLAVICAIVSIGVRIDKKKATLMKSCPLYVFPNVHTVLLFYLFLEPFWGVRSLSLLLAVLPLRGHLPV